MVKETVLLSELSNDEMLAYEDGHEVYTPQELRERIEAGEELNHHTWYVSTPQEWKPSAKQMIDDHIENEYDNGMYEDWDDRARDCITQEHIDKIQAVLDDMFKGDSVRKYWTLDGAKVIIDL